MTGSQPKGRSLSVESATIQIHCKAMAGNLSVRLFNRRYTRLTLGYSKILDNLKRSTALLIAFFNFCRVHSAHGQTPAQNAGITDHQWTIAELLSY
jgi:hypothetical protein